MADQTSELSFGALSLADWVHRLADGNPTPGGGSASAVAGAMAAALVAMVAGLTVGKERFADVELQMTAACDEAQKLASELLSLAERDARAFDAVMAAYRLPKKTDEEKNARTAAIQTALVEAATVPLLTAGLASRAARLAEEVAALGNPNAITDAATAAHLASAAAHGAMLNVQVNLASIKDEEFVADARDSLQRTEREVRDALEATRAYVATRMG